MPELNIVLVEPQIPQNTGNIARTCAATGCRLHLVGPLGFAIDDKKLKRAGLDYWHLLDITRYAGLEEFFSRNPGPFFYYTTKGRRTHSDATYPDGSYLVFTVQPGEDTLAAVVQPRIPLPLAIGGIGAAVVLLAAAALLRRRRKAHTKA